MASCCDRLGENGHARSAAGARTPHVDVHHCDLAPPHGLYAVARHGRLPRVPKCIKAERHTRVPPLVASKVGLLAVRGKRVRSRVALILSWKVGLLATWNHGGCGVRYANRSQREVGLLTWDERVEKWPRGCAAGGRVWRKLTSRSWKVASRGGQRLERWRRPPEPGDRRTKRGKR